MQKPIRVSGHARRRMERYMLGEDVVIEALREPDRVVAGYRGRRIAHKFMNDHVLRVVYEEDDFIAVCGDCLSYET